MKDKFIQDLKANLENDLDAIIKKNQADKNFDLPTFVGKNFKTKRSKEEAIEYFNNEMEMWKLREANEILLELCFLLWADSYHNDLTATDKRVMQRYEPGKSFREAGRKAFISSSQANNVFNKLLEKHNRAYTAEEIQIILKESGKIK